MLLFTIDNAYELEQAMQININVHSLISVCKYSYGEEK